MIFRYNLEFIKAVKINFWAITADSCGITLVRARNQENLFFKAR